MIVSVALCKLDGQRTDGKPRGAGSRRPPPAAGPDDQASRRRGRLRTDGPDLRPALIIGKPLHRHQYQKEEGDDNVAPLNIIEDFHGRSLLVSPDPSDPHGLTPLHAGSHRSSGAFQRQLVFHDGAAIAVHLRSAFDRTAKHEVDVCTFGHRFRKRHRYARGSSCRHDH